MYQDYKDLLSAFNAHGVKYLIVGGYAVFPCTAALYQGNRPIHKSRPGKRKGDLRSVGCLVSPPRHPSEDLNEPDTSSDLDGSHMPSTFFRVLTGSTSTPPGKEGVRASEAHCGWYFISVGGSCYGRKLRRGGSRISPMSRRCGRRRTPMTASGEYELHNRRARTELQIRGRSSLPSSIIKPPKHSHSLFFEHGWKAYEYRRTQSLHVEYLHVHRYAIGPGGLVPKTPH